MSKNKVEIKINLNSSNFQKGMRKVSLSFKNLKDNIIVANQAVDLFSRIKSPLMANIHAAGMQEQAFKSLDITLRNTGRSTKDYLVNLENLAKNLSNQSIYGSENIIQGIDVLMRYGGITNDIIPQATQTMIDLASVMGSDVPTAARLLGQSSDDMTSALTRYGIKINPAIAASGDFAKILSEIESKVKGHAEAMSSTGYGGFIRMQNAITDITKTFGTFSLEIGKAGVFQFITNAANAASIELNKTFTPENAASVSNSILDIAVTTADTVDYIISLTDFIPNESLKYGIIGYILLGRQGAIAGALAGIAEEAELFGKNTTISEWIVGQAATIYAWKEDLISFEDAFYMDGVAKGNIARNMPPELAAAERRYRNAMENNNLIPTQYTKAALEKAEQEYTNIKNIYNILEENIKKNNAGDTGLSLPKGKFGNIARELKANIKNPNQSENLNKPDTKTSPHDYKTDAQLKLMDDLVKKTQQAQRELVLLKYPEGLIRNIEAVNLQAEDYLKNTGLAVEVVNDWKEAQLKLLNTQDKYNHAKAQEIELAKQAEARMQAEAQQLENLKAEIAKMQGEKVYHENIRVKGEYVAGIDGINAQADELLLNSGDNSALKNIAESWREVALAEHEAKEALNYYKFDFQEATDLMHEGMQALSQPLATALFKGTTDGLASALAESLKMFAAQKAAHLLMESAYETTIGIATMLNPMREWESGFHFAAAKEFALGAALMGTFVMASNLRGMAHSGIDYIPREGTWLLDKGERVIDSRTNKDLKEFIAKGANNVTVNVTINDGDKDSVLEALPVLRKVIVDTVSNNIMSGGQIKRVIREYN